jgi:zinc protease
MASATFGAQPMGTHPTARELQRIRPGEVLKWVNKIRRPGNAALVIVGNIEPHAALAAARAELEGWAAGASSGLIEDPAPSESIAPTEPGRLLIEHRQGSQQATAQVRCLLPRATANNFPARVLYADILKKLLFDELRERLGGSYGVTGGVEVIPGGTDLLELSTDVDYPALPTVLRHMRRLLGGPAPSNDISEETRRGSANRFHLRAVTTPAMAGRLFDMWNLGWPIDTLDRLPEAALTVTPAELAAVADNCRDNWLIGLLGDEPRLRAAWTASWN